MTRTARTLCTLLLLLALTLPCAPAAHAKTVAEWLEGFDTGEVWFGEDFPYDITDEAACWELLQRPITVLDAGQRDEIYPRQTPGGKKVNNDKLGGFINGASAAVHVLGEDEDGWTKIEGLDYYNRVIRGYVRTRLLKTVTPNKEYGVIIDKLTQRLYVFHNGKLWSSVAVSTGLPNDEQPYNETAAGEYLMVSRVGDFNSEGMICAMALRFNGGDMIHEVPHSLRADGTQHYTRWEALLGQKASHGCVRTSRYPSAEGLSATWLWKNLPLNAKVLVWDDKGRVLPYPDDGAVLYYNPDGGQSYHCVADCDSVRSDALPLTPFTYGELEDDAFRQLEVCPLCHPDRRKSAIARRNYEHGLISLEEFRAALTLLPYPDDDMELYYNPNGGQYYHSTANCSSVKERFLPLTGFPYGELENGSFAKLTPCPSCNPVGRKAEIDQQNLAMERLSSEFYDVVQGAIPYPDDKLLMYYNSVGGKNYHCTAYCSSVSDRFLPLTGFPYGELDTAPYSKLKPCPGCKPEGRKAEIDAVNREKGFPDANKETARTSDAPPENAAPSESDAPQESDAPRASDLSQDAEVSITISDGE